MAAHIGCGRLRRYTVRSVQLCAGHHRALFHGDLRIGGIDAGTVGRFQNGICRNGQTAVSGNDQFIRPIFSNTADAGLKTGCTHYRSVFQFQLSDRLAAEMIRWIIPPVTVVTVIQYKGDVVIGKVQLRQTVEVHVWEACRGSNIQRTVFHGEALGIGNINKTIIPRGGAMAVQRTAIKAHRQAVVGILGEERAADRSGLRAEGAPHGGKSQEG